MREYQNQMKLLAHDLLLQREQYQVTFDQLAAKEAKCRAMTREHEADKLLQNERFATLQNTLAKQSKLIGEQKLALREMESVMTAA